MAEAALASVTSQASAMALQRPHCIWRAKKDLAELVQMIQAVIVDAERKQHSSAEVKAWIERLTGVLDDVDALFDEIAMDNLLKAQKVRALLNPFAPCIPSFNRAKRLKVLVQSLLQIYKDSLQFHFEVGHYELPERYRKRNPQVVGRDDDKKSILQLLFEESTVEKSGPLLIAVVGIGGIGKTTLAQLVYNDAEVGTNFNTRWWASLSTAANFEQVVRNIFQAIVPGKRYADYSIGQLQDMIRESFTSSGDYLLILDDVWDDIHHDDWLSIMELLTGKAAERGKIIVTTRYLSVPRAMHIDEHHIYKLSALSDDDSWELFKSKAMHIDDTSSIMSALRLSYDHLPSNLKQCFAYCSVFPKDHLILRQHLIYLWIAHGYITGGDHRLTLEEAGNQCFKELVDRGFLQETEVDDHGEMISCKMHDLIHDLAQLVAGVQTVTLPQGLGHLISMNKRHASSEGKIDDSWNIPLPVLEADRLRSLLLFGNSGCSLQVLDQHVMKFRSLRALDLHSLNIEELPSSIQELKHLRYLNLSQNTFACLPESITMLVHLLFLDISSCQQLQSLPNYFNRLVNLRHLDISSCRQLQSLPNDFSRLVNLRHLDIGYCDSLQHMSPGFGEFTSLVQLRYLNLPQNTFPSIPDSIKELKHLTYLNLSQNTFPCLPDSIKELKHLRYLNLSQNTFPCLPDSIKKLKHLKYLNLSQNTFPCLPDSIAMLVNLLTLDISCCRRLQSLPNDFRRLTILRHLDISYCDNLWHMPPGFGELAFLEQLSDFKVSKHGGGNSSGLDELAKLNLRGKLAVTFDQKRTWRREELMLKRNHIPERITELSISDYPSMKLPCLWKETGNDVISNLKHLVLIRCGQVKHLPPLKCLPDLISLRLYHLPELEYLDDNDVGSTTVFYPSLERLELVNLPKLKQWSRGIEEARAHRLLYLEIKYCYCLKSMPRCPCLQRLWLEGTSSELVTQLLPTCSSPSDHSSTASSYLEDITIKWCSELTCFPGECLTALRKLDIRNCTSLKKLELASHVLEGITISNCPVLRRQLKEDEERGVDWQFLKYLRPLNIDEISEETDPPQPSYPTYLPTQHTSPTQPDPPQPNSASSAPPQATPITVRGYSFGRENFEMFMVPYVQQIRNVRSDGNCGFRALSLLLGRSENEWPEVRRSILDETRRHPGRYAGILRGTSMSEFQTGLNWFNETAIAPERHWMDMPACGVLFATIYQCTLVYLDWFGTHTSLPLCRQDPAPHAPPPDTILVLVRDRIAQHFVAVTLTPRFPMPPILESWAENCDVAVAF